MIHISLAAEPIFRLGPITITNSLLTALAGSGIIFSLFYSASRQVALYPKGRLSQLIESLCELVLALIQQMTGSRQKAAQFFPLLLTIFIFVVINNWIGLLPGIGSVVIKTAESTVPLFRGANADLNTTLALAIVSVVAIQFYALRELGFRRHMKKYFTLDPIYSFVGLLELISEFSKVISFSFRLFGNIFAGEVLLLVIAYLLPLIGPLPFFGLELFVGLIQALVFTMLTLVFLVIATADHGHEEDRQEANDRSPVSAEVTALT
jgi:F-type H+-transporting ATPase subunit a